MTSVFREERSNVLVGASAAGPQSRGKPLLHLGSQACEPAYNHSPIPSPVYPLSTWPALVCISEWDLTSPPTEAIPDIPRLTWMASSLPHCLCAHLKQTTCLSTSPDCELPESKVFASPTFTIEPGLWLALNVYRMNGLRGGGQCEQEKLPRAWRESRRKNIVEQ